ncbi:MAG: orotate phosphoribosyltransferase [Deltaproteobacteria bacterium]|nr:MAG: orotate phosphoribosyltransferase [Deltaproteobacteria bacterium]
MSDAHTELLALLREKSVKYGTFTLASGKTSDFYVDARQTTLHARGSALVAQLVLERLADGVVGVGGLTMGADPVASSAAALSGHLGRPVHGFLIRKEPKGHGVGAYVVGLGNLPEGSKVCIVEDTTTTGGSLLKAVDRAREAGLDVVQTLTVVDRQEGASERLAEHGFTLEALATRAQLEGKA